MSRFTTIFLAFLLASLAWSCNITGKREVEDAELSRYLPLQEELGEWRFEDPPRGFEGEDLFIYINGGADIYHEYGFKRVLVQEYKNRRGKKISLEIFEMTGDRGAYGIYSFKTGRGGEEVPFGNGGLLEGYYMNFWKGNLLVTLTGSDDSEEARRGLKRIAEAVDAKMPCRGRAPHLIRVLEEKGRIPRSEKYLAGHLGLVNCYPFFFGDVFEFEEGVKADFENGCTIFVLHYRDEEACRRKFALVKEKFEASTKYQNFTSREGSFTVSDEEGRTISGQYYGTCILLGIEEGSGGASLPIVNCIKERIDRLAGGD